MRGALSPSPALPNSKSILGALPLGAAALPLGTTLPFPFEPLASVKKCQLCRTRLGLLCTLRLSVVIALALPVPDPAVGTAPILVRCVGDALGKHHTGRV